jgi:AcrR family transcriptional regulator
VEAGVGKGEDRKRTIVEQGLDLASEVGLEAVTFGVLANRVGMSKSGLYAHFDTKEDLQIAVLDLAAEDFVDAVVAPALKQPRGEPRVRALFELWLAWPGDRLTGGCPFIAATTELDDRPGPVRDRLVAHLRDLLGALERAATIAVEEQHFRADLEVQQLAYEIWANLVAHHHYAHLFHSREASSRARRAFDALIQRARA